MALDSPQLTDFANDELRQLGDLFKRIDLRSAAAITEYNARDLGTVINAGGSSGPVLDGRKLMAEQSAQAAMFSIS